METGKAVNNSCESYLCESMLTEGKMKPGKSTLIADCTNLVIPAVLKDSLDSQMHPYRTFCLIVDKVFIFLS